MLVMEGMDWGVVAKDVDLGVDAGVLVKEVVVWATVAADLDWVLVMVVEGVRAGREEQVDWG